MKIYATRSSDRTNPFAKFVGKPVWVRVLDPRALLGKYWYIKIFSMSDSQVVYQCIHADYLKNDARPIYDDMRAFQVAHYVNKESPKTFYEMNQLCEPLDILSDEEVFRQILEEYDG